MPGVEGAHRQRRARGDGAAKELTGPRADRPRFGYGIETEPEGMLPWEWALVRLRESRSYWISTVRPDGSPHAMPVWGVMLDETVYFSTSPASRKGRNLERDPRVVVHTESGDECVILEGVVEVVEIDERIADAYEAKYERYRPDPAKSEDESWYRVRPSIAWAWREAEYTKTATRFEF